MLSSGILGFAHFLLNFPCVLLDFPGKFLRRVARDFSNHFLHGALDFVLGTFGAIFVHDLLHSRWIATHEV